VFYFHPGCFNIPGDLVPYGIPVKQVVVIHFVAAGIVLRQRHIPVIGRVISITLSRKLRGLSRCITAVRLFSSPPCSRQVCGDTDPFSRPAAHMMPWGLFCHKPGMRLTINFIL